MKDMKLQWKMQWSFMLVTIFALIGALFRFFGVYQLGAQIHELGSVRFTAVDNLWSIYQAQATISAGEQALLNQRLEREIRQTLAKEMDKASGQAQAAWDRLNEIRNSNGEETRLPVLKTLINQWRDQHEKLRSAVRDRDNLPLNDPQFARQEERLQELYRQERECHKMLQDELESQIRSNRVAAQSIEEKAKGKVSSNNFWSLTLAGFGFVLAFVFAYILSRNITGPINRVALMLSNGSEKTTAAAEQVSRASQQLAGGAAEQAASLEQTSASLEEMASMTRKNAENAQRAKDLAGQAREAADTGTGEMKDMNVGMETIKTSVREMGVAMAAIKTSSDEISKIIKTIDEIAFQTNILALNAAVEAARAGEYGMGFAVVADEVRNLAQRSAQAAKETAQKIEDSIRNSEQGVRVSEKVAQGLLQAVNKANEVDLRLKEIAGRVHQVDELVAEIAVASREQSQGIEQIDNAVNQMDRVTQSNAGNAEETASAAEELKVQADALKHSVEELVSLVEGQATSLKEERLLSGSRTPPKGLGESGARGPVPVKVTIHSQQDAKDGAEKPAGGRIEKGRQGLLTGGAAKGKAARDEIPMDQSFKSSF